MKNYKKLLAFLMCIIMVVSITSVTASAYTLPDGGQVTNTGMEKVEGRSSGGDDGYANIVCSVTATNATKDKAKALLKSDVTSNLSAINTVVVWYTTQNDGIQSATNSKTVASIPTSGYEITATGANAYGTYATAGHSVTFTKRGYWVSGTKDYF